jgi:hypothetical protein
VLPENTLMSFEATRIRGRNQRDRQERVQELGHGGPRTPNRKRTRDSKPSMEVLENRIALTTFFVVNSLDGPDGGPAGSLRSAITQATQPGSGTNRVVISSNVDRPINLTAGQIPIGASLDIENLAGSEVVIRQTESGERVFQVGTGATEVTINGRSRRTPITIEGGSVTDTNANANGGGILLTGTTDLTLTYVNLTSNTVTSGSGGGIYAQAGTITLVGSSVTQNLAPNGFGGGIYLQMGTVIVRDGSHVEENSALNIGGVGVNSGPGGFEDAVQVIHGSTVNRNSSTSTDDVAAKNFGGGGIAVQGTGSVFVSGSQVSGNQTKGMYSGGILVTLGNVRVTNHSQINGNTNEGPGGGIAANFLGSVIVTGQSQVNDNTGSALGGGIVNFATGAQTVSIEHGSQVSGNTLTNAESLGGALIVFLEAIADGLGADYQTLTGFTPQESKDLIRQVEAEIASAHGVDPSVTADHVVAGGGIGTLLGARVQIQGGSRVERNSSGRRFENNPEPVGIGGAVATILSRIDVDHSTISHNTTTEDGGGLWNRRDVRITHSTIAENHALGLTLSALGGGLFLASPSRGSLIRNSTFRNNGSEFGGGLFNLGSAAVRETTISHNRATKKGGGIDNRGQLTLLRSTVTHNQAGVDGGGISNQGQLTIRHSRIEANAPNDIS